MKIITRISPLSICRFADVPDKLSGISYSPAKKALAFFCSSTGDVGFVSMSSFDYHPRRLEIPAPIGMICEGGNIFVFQSSSNFIWKFNQLLKGGSIECGNKVYADFKSKASFKSSGSAVFCRTGQDTFAMATPLSHQIVTLTRASASILMGCGKSGFSISNNLCSSLLNRPSGVCFDSNSKTLFVADSGNCIVRRILATREGGVIGMPGDSQSADGDIQKARFVRPSIIKMCGKKVVIVDNGVIRSIDLGKNKVTTIYISSRKIIDMTCSNEDVFVMEEE
jgi:hypothetical protein